MDSFYTQREFPADQRWGVRHGMMQVVRSNCVYTHTCVCTHLVLKLVDYYRCNLLSKQVISETDGFILGHIQIGQLSRAWPQWSIRHHSTQAASVRIRHLTPASVQIRLFIYFDQISGGKAQPFLEVIFRRSMKKIEMPQIVPNGFGASIGVNIFFCQHQNRFWGRFGAFLAFRYYLDRDFLMFLDRDFLMFFRQGISDVFIYLATH